MANVVIPVNLGNEFDFGVIEPSKIHIKTDETTVFRDTATGVISAYTIFTGPVLPPAPGIGDPIFAIDDATGITYAWDGATWVPGGGPYTYGSGTDAIEPTITNGNSAGGDRSTVSGGLNNTVDAAAPDSTIAGGTTNNIDGPGSFIGAGDTNAIAAVTGSFIGAGKSNAINASDSAIVSGSTNVVNAGDYSTIGGGQTNSTSGTHSVVAGGQNNDTTNDFTSIAGGGENTANGQYSTVSGGFTNTADNDFSLASGSNALTSFDAERTHGFGEIGGSGKFGQRKEFTGAATVGPGSTVDLDFLMPTNTVWGGQITVVSQDQTFNGAIEARYHFGAWRGGGGVVIDGTSMISAYGGGTLWQTQLAITVSASGNNVRVTITNTTLAVTMNMIVLMDVLEIR